VSRSRFSPECKSTSCPPLFFNCTPLHQCTALARSFFCVPIRGFSRAVCNSPYYFIIQHHQAVPAPPLVIALFLTTAVIPSVFFFYVILSLRVRGFEPFTPHLLPPPPLLLVFIEPASPYFFFFFFFLPPPFMYPICVLAHWSLARLRGSHFLHTRMMSDIANILLGFLSLLHHNGAHFFSQRCTFRPDAIDTRLALRRPF